MKPIIVGKSRTCDECLEVKTGVEDVSDPLDLELKGLYTLRALCSVCFTDRTIRAADELSAHAEARLSNKRRNKK